MDPVQEVPNVASLLAKANKPNDDAMRLHPFYRGKIEVVPKAASAILDDFAIWYTPGVAAPAAPSKKTRNWSTSTPTNGTLWP